MYLITKSFLLKPNNNCIKHFRLAAAVTQHQVCVIVQATKPTNQNRLRLLVYFDVNQIFTCKLRKRCRQVRARVAQRRHNGI